MLENVVEGFVARNPQIRGSQAGEPQVTSKGSTRERFEELFLAHYSKIVAILRRMLGDHGRAEDLASETFLKLYRQPLASDSEGNVPGWLYRTATNLGIDAMRAATRRSRFEQAAAQEQSGNRKAENGFDQALLSQRQARVRAVLADLEPLQAQLLLLRALGHSYKELAAALGIETGSVGTLLVRAEKAFEQRYREHYAGEEDL